MKGKNASRPKTRKILRLWVDDVEDILARLRGRKREGRGKEFYEIFIVRGKNIEGVTLTSIVRRIVMVEVLDTKIWKKGDSKLHIEDYQ